MEETKDRELHDRATRAYYSLSIPNSKFRESLTPEEWTKYKAKFDRFRRLDAKREMLDKEFNEYSEWGRKRWAEIYRTADQRYSEHDECWRDEYKFVHVCSEEGRQYLTGQGRTLIGQKQL